MFSQERSRFVRKVISLGVLLLCLVVFSMPPVGRQVHADEDCYSACDEQKWACEQNCVDSYPGGDGTPGSAFARCRESCNNAWNSCIARCNGFE